jgi:hypothetical protein
MSGLNPDVNELLMNRSNMCIEIVAVHQASKQISASHEQKSALTRLMHSLGGDGLLCNAMLMTSCLRVQECCWVCYTFMAW